MKLILLAATAMLAVPALAQTTTPTTPQIGGAGMQMPGTATPTTADPAQTADPAMTPAPGTPTTTDTMAPATEGSTGTTSQSPSMPAPTTGSTTGSTGMGGTMPMGGTGAAGATTTFAPMQAEPAPAPLASYPICRKGQYDKCMQRGGR